MTDRIVIDRNGATKLLEALDGVTSERAPPSPRSGMTQHLAHGSELLDSFFYARRGGKTRAFEEWHATRAREERARLEQLTSARLGRSLTGTAASSCAAG